MRLHGMYNYQCELGHYHFQSENGSVLFLKAQYFFSLFGTLSLRPHILCVRIEIHILPLYTRCSTMLFPSTVAVPKPHCHLIKPQQNITPYSLHSTPGTALPILQQPQPHSPPSLSCIPPLHSPPFPSLPIPSPDCPPPPKHDTLPWCRFGPTRTLLFIGHPRPGFIWADVVRRHPSPWHPSFPWHPYSPDTSLPYVPLLPCGTLPLETLPWHPSSPWHPSFPCAGSAIRAAWRGSPGGLC